MIWTSQHLNNNSVIKSKSLQESSKYTSDLPTFNKDVNYVAIIGGGPKGFYSLERLIANLRKKQLNKKTVVHWFNSNESFGAGQNYLISQPNYLLINYCIGNINCWEENDCLSFVDECMNLTSWINHSKITSIVASDEDFASRELVGHYLMNAVYDLLHYDIPNFELHLIKASIDDLTESNKLFSLFENNKKLPFDYSSILLATGHCYDNISDELFNHAENSSFNYFHYAYPIQQLEKIPAKSKVAVKGIGLTFIDVMLQLTEGRGGKFVEQNNELSYIPSGNECEIYPFSRCNLPMMPRKAILPNTKYILKYMTNGWVEELKELNRQIDFEVDILPIYNKEIQFAYYSKYFQKEQLSDAQLWQRINQINENEIINIFNFINPNHVFDYKIHECYNNFIKNHLNNVLNEVAIGELNSKVAAAAGACREGLIQLGKLYHFDGFLPESQKDFDRNWYSSLSRMSYGPPIINVQKLHALIKAGTVKFEFCSTPEIDLIDDSISLSTEKNKITANTLIDARIPRGSINRGNNPLYKNLYSRGIIQERFNYDYATDAVAIDRQGKLNDKSKWLLTLYGTPTEINVLDNDSLSRKTHNFGNFWAKETADFLN